MNDPIVREVRQVRTKIAGQFGFDLHALIADVCRRQMNLGGRLVSPERAKKLNPQNRKG